MDAGETYRRDGLYIARSLYTPEEMVNWKERILDLLNEEGHLEASNTGVRVWMVDALDPFLKERMLDSCVVKLLRSMIGDNVEFLSVKAVYKDKNTTFGSPWHQDWYYWKGAAKISVWIALDDATPENGCLKMIPGSHKKKYKVKQVRNEIGFPWRLDNEEVVGLPEITLDVKRGDAVFFHDCMLHSSFPNTSRADRFSFISTYRDASVADDSSVWNSTLSVTG